MKKYFLLLAVVLMVAGIFLPYRAWLERRLELILENKGFENVELTVSSVGLKTASLENVSVGTTSKLNLKNLTLEYSLPELWNGNLRDLSIDGINIAAKQAEGRWVISGLEGWNKKPEKAVAEPFIIPVTAGQLARIPFERIELKNSVLNGELNGAKFILPLDLAWQKSPEPEFVYKGDNPGFKFNNYEITAGNLALDAYIDEEGKKWAGSWALRDINVRGTPVPMPVMAGNGTIWISESQMEIEGKIESNDKSWMAQLSMNYDFSAPEKSNFTVVRAGMPWKEGRIDVRNIKIPLKSQKAIRANLDIQNVSIQELMQSLTGGRVSATGRVSGVLPLLIGRDGVIQPLQGNLKSVGPGKISMPPDVIPGDNQQVALVRQILEDLRYTGLTVALKNDESGRLGVSMIFEGNNPAVYNGRPVKLNVNLKGDVLEFLQQNILLLTNPEQFLEQEHDEKH
jgi:hypothetical protein